MLGSDAKTRNILPNGFYKFVVHNVKELDMLLMHNRYVALHLLVSVVLFALNSDRPCRFCSVFAGIMYSLFTTLLCGVSSIENTAPRLPIPCPLRPARPSSRELRSFTLRSPTLVPS